MSIKEKLMARSNTACELCGSDNQLTAYTLAPASTASEDDSVLVCQTCLSQIESEDKMDSTHWRCLNESMWSTVPAVQVLAWRVLDRLRSEGQGWAMELLDMLYLDDETMKWAKSASLIPKTEEESSAEHTAKHLDAHGAELEDGDTVVLIKDLNVKGAGFTAKRGTAVRRISLVHDNPEQIEGRVEGQQIVILTQFVKKSN